ncbi:MAG: SCP2 sterol-binding domain-containing protein [Acutalibacteraceae bacterium]|jgi:putative sterol carrier protein|nr:SCP2 sterol-binding domain-containing protein [Acutalibacteraceae bacterium]
MTFQEAFNEIKNIFIHSDVHEYKGHLAIQITMTGEGGGTFYVLFNDGELIVEPYDYKDHDTLFIADTQDFLKIARGEMNAMAAYTVGKLRIYGDLGKASEIQRLVGWIRY